jgi:hypothetical protein
MEYLVTMTTHVPGGTSQEAVEDIRTREAARSRRVRVPWRPGQRCFAGSHSDAGTGAGCLCRARTARIPVGHVGQISDIVDGVLLLESSPFITGEILHIDGGQIAGSLTCH